MKNVKIFLALVLLSISLVACSSNGANNTETYPAPNVVNSNPTSYPVDTTEKNSPTPMITQDSSMGLVQGKIYFKGKPLASKLLYLADVLQDSNSNVDIATSLDVNVAPRATTDNDGNYIFQNVKPGRYGLILYEGTSSYLLLNPENNKAIVLDVSSGKDVDLGKMDFLDLPSE